MVMDTWISNFVRVLNDLEKYVSALLVGVIILLPSLDIFSRLLFGQGIIWAHELSKALFIAFIWFSAVYVLKNQSHFRFLLLRQKFSNRTKYGLYLVEWTLWLVFTVLVFRYSLDGVASFRTGSATITGTGVPFWALYGFAITVTFGLLFVRILQQIRDVTREYRRGEDLTLNISLEE